MSKSLKALPGILIRIMEEYRETIFAESRTSRSRVIGESHLPEVGADTFGLELVGKVAGNSFRESRIWRSFLDA